MKLAYVAADPAYTVATDLVYLAVSLLLTMGVGRTLYTHGRMFLVDAFHGNETLADSVNHLLLVGFYLINLGYATFALSYGARPWDLASAIECFSTKIGLVMIVLALMHFINLRLFSVWRRRARMEGIAAESR
jgi:hypothetical protein